MNIQIVNDWMKQVRSIDIFRIHYINTSIMHKIQIKFLGVGVEIYKKIKEVNNEI